MNPTFGVIAIASSAGGIPALLEIVAQLPSDISMPVVVVQHLPYLYESCLVDILRTRTSLQVKWAEDGEALRAGMIYVAPQRSRVVVATGNRLRVVESGRNRLGTPAADPLFSSIAKQFGRRAIGIVLTGALWDGATGIQAMKRRRSTILIQNPETAVAPGMPAAAMQTTGLHFVLPLNRIAPALAALISVPQVTPLLTQANGPLRHWLRYTDNSVTASQRSDATRR